MEQATSYFGLITNYGIKEICQWGGFKKISGASGADFFGVPLIDFFYGVQSPEPKHEGEKKGVQRVPLCPSESTHFTR